VDLDVARIKLRELGFWVFSKNLEEC